MDVLPSGGIFRELQVVHDTGYFPITGQPSFEEDWHQVGVKTELKKSNDLVFLKSISIQ